MEIANFEELLKEMRGQVDNRQQPLYQNLVSIITYCGKVPLNVATESLTNLSESFLHILPLSRGDLRKDEYEKGDFLLTLTETGRLDIFHEDIDKYQEMWGHHVIGSVAIEPAYFDMINDLWQEKERRDNFFYSFVEETIQKWYSEKILDDKIDEAIDWISRVETVYIYSGHKQFISALLPNTTLVRWNNLCTKDPKDNALQKYRGSFVSDIPKEEKTLLVALHCLFNIDGPFGFEELNGTNLTAFKLYTHLISKYYQYFPHNSNQQMISDLGDGIITFSESIGKGSNEIDKTTYLKFRRMNGINFQKKVYLLKKDPLRSIQENVPESFSILASKLRLGESTDIDYRRMVRNIIGKVYDYELSDTGLKVKDVDSNLGYMNWIEYIYYFITRDTAEMCNLDSCFTSGLKDISKLYMDNYRDSQLQAVHLEPSEMFCCFSNLQKQENITVCEGMQGNRWNYLGGNIEKKVIMAENRYCRFPLLFPDISIYNDLHHECHSQMKVKHVIRVSGPLLDDEPLKINGINYRSFFDIRGFRKSDPPFSTKDLMYFIRICKCLDIIWRTIVEFYETGQTIIPIRLFDVDFYKRLNESGNIQKGVA